MYRYIKSLLILSTFTVSAVVSTEDCTFPKELGMQSGKIEDSQITASSNFSERYAPWQGRLRNSQYWATRTGTPSDPWIQVDFLDGENVVTGIQTQGSTEEDLNFDYWVTELQIQTGDSEESLTFIMDGNERITFQANFDPDGIVNITFPEPIRTRYLRIKPTSWNDWPSLRFEVFGCNGTSADHEQSTGAATSVTQEMTNSPTTIETSTIAFPEQSPGLFVGTIAGSSLAILVILFVIIFVSIRKLRNSREAQSDVNTSKETEVNQPYYLTIMGHESNQPPNHGIEPPAYVISDQDTSSNDDIYYDIHNTSNDDADVYYSSVGPNVINNVDVHGNETSLEHADPQTLSHKSQGPQEGDGWEENTAYDSFSVDGGNNGGDDETEGWEDNTLYGVTTGEEVL